MSLRALSVPQEQAALRGGHSRRSPTVFAILPTDLWKVGVLRRKSALTLLVPAGVPGLPEKAPGATPAHPVAGKRD